MIDFFTTLYGDLQGYVPVYTFPTSERTSGKPWKDWSLSRRRWFHWPSQTEALLKYCQDRKGEDVYVTVGLCESKDNNKESNIPSLAVVHCDADLAKPSLFATEPSMTIESSPGKFQLYWVLKESVPAAKAKVLAKKVAYSQRAHGADTGFQSNKLMRVPGTTNTKPQYNMPTVTCSHNGKIYAWKDLKKFFAGISYEANTNVDLPMPKTFPLLPECLAKTSNSTELQNLFNKPAEVTHWNPKGSRFVVLWRLACMLFRQGLSREEVFTICQGSNSNKYEQDNRSPSELWRDVLKAEEEVLSSKLIFVNDDPDQPLADVPLSTGISLLTQDERQGVLTDTFIDKYVGWASKQTLADHRYHKANAITILSTILSEFGYAIPQHGSMGLEMWFMVLGPTTRSYKTTAAKLMLRVLRHLGAEREYPYEVASDVPPEALTVALAKRGEISSLYHVDEAHTTIVDSKGGKSYMNGFLSLLTKLYDGEVPARDRIITGSTKATKTHLTMNMLGVPDKMTESLTREDFSSGFLTRFIFVLGEPAPRDADSRWLNQSDPKAKKDIDPELNKLMMDVAFIRAKWESRCRKLDGGKVPIEVNVDGWARWNKMVLDLDKIADESEDPDAVRPTAERTTVAVHKMACLLAMSEGKNQAELGHILTAISFAEKWYDTMVFVSSLVHENKWSRQVNEVINYIASKGRRSFGAIYNHFNRYKLKEFEEIVESAVHLGKITRTENKSRSGSTTYLEAT